LKVTGLKIFHLGTRSAQQWSYPIVKVETDEDTYGLGECRGVGVGVIGAFEQIKPALIGQDPANIEKLRRDLLRSSRVGWNAGPVMVSAVSAIEIALWDIKGKVLKTPLYNLIGGKVRNKVRVYSNGWFGGCKTPEDFGKAAEKVVGDGYTALKLYPVGYGWEGGTLNLQEIEDIVKSVRIAVGPRVDIMIDGGKLDVTHAIRVGHRLEKYDIFWLEEPVPPGNPDAMASVARNVNIPIAAGENLWTKEEFKDYFEEEALAWVQPDIGNVGGILETLKIAAMADAYLLPIAPHNPNGPVLSAVAAHMGVALSNFLILEFCTYKETHRDTSWLWEVVDYSYEKQYTERKDGYIEVKDRPGLGLELNEELARKHVNIKQITTE